MMGFSRALARRRKLTLWPVRRGMLLGGIVALLAAAAAMWLPIKLTVGLLALCLLGSLLSLFLLRSWRPVVLFCGLWAVAFLVPGICRQIWQFQPILAQAGQEDSIVARVVELPRSGRLYTVEVVSAMRLPAGTTIQLYCPDVVAPELLDEVEVQVQYRALNSDQVYYRAGGVLLLAYPTEYGEEALQVRASGGARPWRQWLQSLRDTLVNKLSQCLPGDEGSLLAAVCFGERGGLSRHIQEAFRLTGLSHLLAISGLHITVIAGGVRYFLRLLRLPPAAAAALTMLLVGLFAWLVGFTPSVSRACFMCWVLLSGQLLRYPADSLNSLGVALVVLLAADIHTLYDVGFWLSFGATGGILCLTPRFKEILGAGKYRQEERPFPKRLLWLWGKVANSLAVTLGATLPILPLLAWLFREVAWIAPLYNLLTALLSTCILLLGCVGGLLCALPLVGCVGKLLLIPAGWLSKLLLWLVDLPSEGALYRVWDPWNFLWVLAICVWVVICITVLSRRPLYRGGVLFLALLLILQWGSSRLESTHHRVWVVPGEDMSLYVKQGEHTALVIQSPEDLSATQNALEELGLPPAEIVVSRGVDTAGASTLLDLCRSGGHYVTVGEATWATALSVDNRPFDGATELWEGCTLRLTATGQWQLTLQGAILYLAPPGEERIEGPLPPMLLANGGSFPMCLQAASSGSLSPGAIPVKTACCLVAKGTGEWRLSRWL